MQRVVIILGLVVAAGAGLYWFGGAAQIGAQDATQSPEPDPTIAISPDDANMAAANAAAQATLATFLAQTTNDAGYSSPTASLKVEFPLLGGNSEVIWLQPFVWYGDDTFAGQISYQPRFLTQTIGSSMTFTTDMIQDWGYLSEDGALYGHYTTRVLIPQMDAETAEVIGAMLADAPVPPEWN